MSTVNHQELWSKAPVGATAVRLCPEGSVIDWYKGIVSPDSDPSQAYYWGNGWRAVEGQCPFMWNKRHDPSAWVFREGNPKSCFILMKAKGGGDNLVDTITSHAPKQFRTYEEAAKAAVKVASDCAESRRPRVYILEVKGGFEGTVETKVNRVKI